MSTPLPYLSELFRIISGALRLDAPKVRNYTAFLADKLAEAGDAATAARLRKLLEESDHQLRPAEVSAGFRVPVDGETRFALLEKVDPKHTPEPAIVLPQLQQDLVSEFITICKAQAQFEVHGVSTSATLLLFGPPGCGKSRLARHVARELGMDIYVARLDGLISSYLGSTSKNIRAIFEFAASNPCVLLLDEFDAIAKLRDDKQELGELKRVVNSFLQNLDWLGNQSVVIAATNHHLLLDPAVWRRFSYVIELAMPASPERLRLWINFWEGVEWSSREIDILADLSEGFSGGDIREVALRLRRQMVISGQRPNLADVLSALKRVAAATGGRPVLAAALRNLEPHAVARKLHRRDPRLYSHSQLGALLGVSKATAHRWTVTGAKNGRPTK